MAVTKLTDIIIPEFFKNYMVLKSNRFDIIYAGRRTGKTYLSEQYFKWKIEGGSKMKRKIVKEKFYFYRDGKGEQRITVCLLLDNYGNTSRGIAVCSNDEKSFDEEQGKRLAKRHAKLAWKGGKAVRHLTFKDERVLGLLVWCKCPWGKKCEMNPALAPFEKRMLYGKKWYSKNKLPTGGSISIGSGGEIKIEWPITSIAYS